MLIEDWALERIIPYPNNPRARSKKAVQKVADSIKEFGVRQPIVVDEAGVILVGHTRRDAAQLLCMPTFPVHQALDLSEAQKKAYRIADNRTNEETTWDLPLLTLELGEIKGLGLDLSTTGFDLRQVNGYLRGGPVDGEDDIPEPGPTVTQRGDLWIMGEHRLLCGDATSAEDVALVMDGERAGLMNTDPPYGVGYANDERPNPGVAKPRVAKDDLRGKGLEDFLSATFDAAKAVSLRANAAWYLWHAGLTQTFFAAAAAAAAHVGLHCQIIWVKPAMLLGRGMFHWQHEPCLMGWLEGNRPPDYAPRTQTTVWQIGSIKLDERREFNHSTPKPVELFRLPILKHLQPGEVAYEPFAGSGPQFIAAEAEGRRCYGLEIEPRYCDVIVSRWEKFTGKKAILERKVEENTPNGENTRERATKGHSERKDARGKRVAGVPEL